jgi:hypothetical protein
MLVGPYGAPDALHLGLLIPELVALSLVFAWLFERAGRSLAVALALHAGLHLDNVNLGPDSEVRLRVLRFVVLAVAAAFAARALAARPTEEAARSVAA